jgi:hypothetical protein
MTKTQIHVDDQGWPVLEGKVPFGSRGEHITALYAVIEKVRERVQADSGELRETIGALEAILKDSFEIDLGPVREYSARLLNPKLEINDGEQMTYAARKERLAKVWKSITGQFYANSEKAAEIALDLAEKCRNKSQKNAELGVATDVGRVKEVRALYELAKDMTNNPAIRLAAEARLLEMRIYGKEVASEEPISAEFATLAYDDPALIIGRYGSVKSLSLVTRAIFTENLQVVEMPVAKFVRSMYEVRCNRRMLDSTNDRLLEAIAEESGLIFPLVNAACSLPAGYEAVRVPLAEMGLLAAVKERFSGRKAELYAKVNSSLPVEEVQQIFAGNVALNEDLFQTRYQLGFEAQFERNIGNEKRAQEHEARLARLPLYQ